MASSLARAAITGALLCVAPFTYAQTQTSTTATKDFEVIAVERNDLVVRLPEGTRRLTVPDDFRFTVDGQQLSIHDLKAGMRGTATITTRTTVTPVTVTEVRNGSVVMASGNTIYVRTADGVRQFTQSEVDKRGVSIVREGKPAQVSDFRPGDTLSATIITSGSPRVVTEQEVQATLARAATVGSSTLPAAAGSGGGGQRVDTATAAPAPAPEAPSTGSRPTTLPSTASQVPSLAAIGVIALMLASGLALRRLFTS